MSFQSLGGREAGRFLPRFGPRVWLEAMGEAAGSLSKGMAEQGSQTCPSVLPIKPFTLLLVKRCVCLPKSLNRGTAFSWTWIS